LEPPCHLELAEIRRVDLVQRGVLAAAQVGRIHRPLAARRARLCWILAGDLLETLNLLAGQLLRGVPRRDDGQHGNDREEPNKFSGHADELRAKSDFRAGVQQKTLALTRSLRIHSAVTRPYGSVVVYDDKITNVTRLPAVARRR